jgi:hypothetical protein
MTIFTAVNTPNCNNLCRQSVATPFDQFTTQDLGAVSLELSRLMIMWEGVLTTEISLMVVDNGIGPRPGDPGLGSSLFNSIAGSKWSFTRGPDGVGAQLNLQISK